jgi:hypothetical protein
VVGETITWHRHTAGAPDAHGNATSTWTDVQVSGVAVAPRQGEEPRNNRDMVILGLTVYMPAGTAIGAQDEVTVRQVRYRVVGEPGVWTNPYSGDTKGVQAALEQVEG